MLNRGEKRTTFGDSWTSLVFAPSSNDIEPLTTWSYDAVGFHNPLSYFQGLYPSLLKAGYTQIEALCFVGQMLFLEVGKLVGDGSVGSNPY